MKTIIEPFKIKMVEPIKLTTRDERERVLRRAHFNVFQIPAEEVIALFLEKYSPREPDHHVATIVRSLGYFGDVADDPALPVQRETIESYWEGRQREVLANLSRH